MRIAVLDDLRYKRLAIGLPGSGVGAFTEPLLAANNVTGFDAYLVRKGNLDALRSLQRGEVDAALLIGPVQRRPSSLIFRLAKPEEVANVVAFLASDRAAVINGAAIRAEGGTVQTIA